MKTLRLLVFFLVILQFYELTAQEVFVGDNATFFISENTTFTTNDENIKVSENGNFIISAGNTWTEQNAYVDGNIVITGAGNTNILVGDEAQSAFTLTTLAGDRVTCSYTKEPPTGNLDPLLTDYFLSETEFWTVNKIQGTSTDYNVADVIQNITATYNGSTTLGTLVLMRFNTVSNQWERYEDSPGFGDFTLASRSVKLATKVALQGAKTNPVLGEETLMRDDLRVDNLLPLMSPYNDNLMTTNTVFAITGDNAIVDWIWIELRDATDDQKIITSRSALVQRDGDVVDVDGTSLLTLQANPMNYYVVVRHRNHLSVMTQNTLPLDANSTTLDFTDSTTTLFGNNGQIILGDGSAALWAGNVNNDTVIQYTGTTPDAPSILAAVLNDAGNFLNFPTYVINGYNVNDINMDGKTQYTGTTPDTPFILQNVLAHPGNFLNFSTYQILEQLPEN